MTSLSLPGAGAAPTVPVTASTATQSKRLRPDRLLYALVCFTWVAVWRIQDIFPILATVEFPIFVQLSTLALFVMDSSPLRRVQKIKSPMLFMILALFGIMVFGLPTSLWPGKGVTFLLRDFIPTLVLMVMLAVSIRETPDLEWFALANLIGGVIYAIYVYLFCPVGYNGRLGSLVYYDANDFALIIVCTIPFAIYHLRPGVARWKRLLGIFALGFFVLMIIRSGSRGGFIGLIAVMLYALLRYRGVPAKWRLAAVGGGAFVLLVFGSSTYWTNIATILHPENDYNMTEDVGRKAVWQRGMGYMFTHPLLGVGIRAFPQAEGMLSETARRYAETGKGIKWSVAHNSFVEVGAECGVGGLLLFVGVLVSAIIRAAHVRPNRRRAPHISTDDQAYAQMLIAALVGFIVAGFFVSAEYFAYLYVLLALVMAQQAVLQRRVRRGPAPATPVRSRQAPAKPKVAVQWSPSGQ